MSYYTNINPDLLEVVPMNARRVLEIGCGDGSFAGAVKARNPSVCYTGVELFDEAATAAKRHVDQVIKGNIEDQEIFTQLEQSQVGDLFDVLIFGDVLEHLLDPWALLSKLRKIMTLNAVCVICIPNVSHWSLLKQQLSGRWNYADSGLLDRTHLRFFTRETATEMLEGAGWSVVGAKPRNLWADQTKLALKQFEPVIEAFGLNKAKANIDLSAFQWIISAVNGPSPSLLNIAGLTIKKMAGVNEARVDFPLRALNTMVGVQAHWGEVNVSIPSDAQPGILVLHRQFLNHAGIVDHVEKLIAKGWIVVSDIDDDPRHWAGYIASDFIAFQGVHAVSVSTSPLAELIRQWNPNVAILPNGIFQMPISQENTDLRTVEKRIFFGALNRLADWNAIKTNVIPKLIELREKVTFVVVHDKEIYESLPSEIKTEFHATLPPDEYMKVLQSCDIALLPLTDSPFNRLKSDLKLIECCAAGVVPIFSEVVYGDNLECRDLGAMVSDVENWGSAIARLVQNQDELEHLKKVGLDYVTSKRMHAHAMDERLKWYRSLIENRQLLEQSRQQRLAILRKTTL
jgi:SAM-dependent methyltransferase